MHNNRTRVTVVLPFYQAGKELDTAVESLVQQTFSRWRLLLVSNNGSDEGWEIATRWSASDPRIEVIKEPIQGIAHALNAGLQQVDTDYVARMDADDRAMPERLQLQADFLDAHPGIEVVSSQTTYDSGIAGSHGYKLFVDWQNSIITPEEHALKRFVEAPLAHPAVMFRKSLIDRFGLYSTRNVPEDYELWLRWMDQQIRFYKLPEPLLVWTDHESRLSRTHDNYSREAFYRIKCEYLARWIRRNVPAEKKIIVCGSSRIGRKRAALLEELGVDIHGFTDVKKRPNRQVRFYRTSELTEPAPWFLVNFIARRGVGQAIQEHFTALGFREGIDFILAA
ncbi:MAG: glycosyltransferase [Bacteroidales bacterium]